jgi:hypothetical protein
VRNCLASINFISVNALHSLAILSFVSL